MKYKTLDQLKVSELKAKLVIANEKLEITTKMMNNFEDAIINDFMPILEKVAFIGVDFGDGPYVLEQEYIEIAQKLTNNVDG